MSRSWGDGGWSPDDPDDPEEWVRPVGPPSRRSDPRARPSGPRARPSGRERASRGPGATDRGQGRDPRSRPAPRAVPSWDQPRRPSGRPGRPPGSGLPPTVPTRTALLLGAVAVLLAFVIGRATGGGGSPLTAVATTAPVTAGPAVTVTTAAAGQTYTVVQGDTLAAIASRYGVTADALAQANQITDPSRLAVGQQLRIPASTATTTTTRRSS